MIRAVINGCADIGKAFRMRKVWLALAREDVDDSHRRTTLGPAWLLINYLVMVGTFVVILGQHIQMEAYPAYVAIGFLVWNFIQEAIGPGTTLFVREESFIKGTLLPLSAYVLRQTMQSVIRMSYALFGCAAIVLFTGLTPVVEWLWAVPGILLVLITGPAAIIIFAIAGALFPDLQFVVNNALRVMMFLTPIFWVDTGGGGLRTLLYHFNPVTYYIEIVRIPILDGVFPEHAMMIALPIAAAFWIVALALLGAFRKKLVFVL